MLFYCYQLTAEFSELPKVCADTVLNGFVHFHFSGKLNCVLWLLAEKTSTFRQIYMHNLEIMPDRNGWVCFTERERPRADAPEYK